jgi:hypothetical protein
MGVIRALFSESRLWCDIFKIEGHTSAFLYMGVDFSEKLVHMKKIRLQLAFIYSLRAIIGIQLYFRAPLGSRFLHDSGISTLRSLSGRISISPPCGFYEKPGYHRNVRPPIIIKNSKSADKYN